MALRTLKMIVHFTKRSIKMKTHLDFWSIITSIKSKQTTLDDWKDVLPADTFDNLKKVSLKI